MWKIKYKKSIKKDLKKISKENQTLIRRAIEDKLMVDPVKFGAPLQRNLKGLKKLRVGNFRVVYELKRKQVIVHVIKIGHRKEVYLGK